MYYSEDKNKVFKVIYTYGIRFFPHSLPIESSWKQSKSELENEWKDLVLIAFHIVLANFLAKKTEHIRSKGEDCAKPEHSVHYKTHSVNSIEIEENVWVNKFFLSLK